MHARRQCDPPTAIAPHVNARKESAIESPYSKIFLELDLWFKDDNISFEFQDAYHYITTWYHHHPLREIQKLVNKRGTTLIHVPCWWDGKEESLIATIRFSRPDLLTEFSHHHLSISLNPPSGYFSVPIVPDIGGELMLASIASQYSHDFTSWWMGEKYDGVRCIWNPIQSQLYSRAGAEIDIPDSFVSLFPKKNFLDGEYGRGGFSEAQNIIRGEGESWQFFRVVVFDEPSPAIQRDTYEIRYSSFVSSFIPAFRVKILSQKQLQKNLIFIIDHQGEGLILCKPSSSYHHGRSSHLMKIKAMNREVEALVVGIQNDIHSIIVQLPTGIHMSITAKEFIDKIKKGDIVTMEYESESQPLVPSSPTVRRIRRDLSWIDVLFSFASQVNDPAQNVLEFSKPPKFWTVQDKSHFRSVFESFAAENRFDPLVPDNWYSITRSHFAKFKGSSTALSHFDTLQQALSKLFPELTFDEKKFVTKPTKYWHSVARRKEYFNAYAKAKGFDPRVADNWYSIPKEAIQSEPEARSLLTYYNMNIANALIHLYPDIGLKKENFSRNNSEYWNSRDNRRNLFNRIAKVNSFDPLIPANWYNFTPKMIFSTYKDAPIIIEKYRGNYVAALLDLYPEIGLEEHKFNTRKVHKYWNDPKNRRKVFDRIAHESGFNPLIPENWYSVSRTFIINQKDASAALEYYQGSVINALIDLYPNVSFNKLMVTTRDHGVTYWENKQNRREFFINFAKLQRFDPLVPSNWYSVSKKSIMKLKNINAVLKYHKGDYFKAIIELFPELKLSMRKFDKPGYWKNNKNRVLLFNEIAKTQNFDPLVAENWYSISHSIILAFEGGKELLEEYQNNHKMALQDTYPNIGISKTKFKKSIYN